MIAQSDKEQLIEKLAEERPWNTDKDFWALRRFFVRYAYVIASIPTCLVFYSFLGHITWIKYLIYSIVIYAFARDYFFNNMSKEKLKDVIRSIMDDDENYKKKSSYKINSYLFYSMYIVMYIFIVLFLASFELGNHLSFLGQTGYEKCETLKLLSITVATFLPWLYFEYLTYGNNHIDFYRKNFYRAYKRFSFMIHIKKFNRSIWGIFLFIIIIIGYVVIINYSISCKDGTNITKDSIYYSKNIKFILIMCLISFHTYFFYYDKLFIIYLSIRKSLKL